ncbi:MAG TPA: hypothetical protein VG267_10440 [Terracidiphilus sp.]|jgi:hypothetical protein|nr:hypothetical protein [Terracidiphilus sp.]
MPAQAHPLEPFFHHEVTAAFEGKLGLNDPEISAYIAKVLCSFSETDSLFLRSGLAGHSLEELNAMMLAADPVHGAASSFDAERSMRKYIGDYALFVAGMLPEAISSDAASQNRRPTIGELIRAGKESYYIVSQFTVFEYKKDAPLFARLSEQFERYVLGLALVREELGKRLAMGPPPSA